MNMQLLVTILVAFAAMAFVFLIYQVVAGRKERTDERLERFGKVGSAHAEEKGGERFEQLLDQAARFAKPLESKSEEDQSALKIRLANGGWRSEGADKVFLGVKFIFLLIGLGVAMAVVLPSYGFSSQDGWMYALLIAGLSFYLPDVFVRLVIKKRQESIFYGLPDALDLMVVCVESGLGLDAAMRKVCEEMNRNSPIISEEFSISNFQLQMGRPRRDVLHDLGVRTGVDDMKSLAAILIQADRFGSSIAQALRVQSDSMRVRRRQQAEERAAKTAVQLIFPLVLFIFPAVFIVLVGPAAIQIVQTLMSM